MHAHNTTRYWSHFRRHDLSAHGMYYLDFGHSVVSTSHSVSAAGVQRDRMIPGSSTREVCSGFYTYMCNEPLHTCASGVKQLVCLRVSVLTDTMNQTIFRVIFALNNNAKLPAFLCLLPHYTTLCNYTVTNISVCTTELHMLYYYTVDVPTYTVPDMIREQRKEFVIFYEC